MNRREKMLAVSLGLLAAGFAAYGAANKLVIKPLMDLNQDARNMTSQIDALSIYALQEPVLQQRLEQAIARTLGQDILTIDGAMRERIVGLLEPSGLLGSHRDEIFNSPPPSQGRKINKQGDIEISRVINVRNAALANIVNFMHLLSSDRRIHRIEGLSLSPQGPGKMNLSLKYTTLAIKLAGRQRATSRPAQAANYGDLLASSDRNAYEPIVARDIFRRYVPSPTPPAIRHSSPIPSAAVQPPRLRLAGLPTLAGKQIVQVFNAANNQVQNYEIGQDLAGATIVAIDCRPMLRPKSGDPRYRSASRVILKIGSEFWAVELGDSIDSKHRMDEGDLPAGLVSVAPEGIQQ
ncbi:MAG: hypothetical protein GXY38_13520 [Planctomycetes bacterium]|jgi:hypothetical protein|nr:hypothetical protein [Planctomycetota bacterium]